MTEYEWWRANEGKRFRDAIDIMSRVITAHITEVARLTAEKERLRAALTVSRGQWIHSVNAQQCLAALDEGEPK